MDFDKLLNLCSERNLTVASLERKLNLGNGTIRKWQSSTPTLENAVKVAQFFGVPVESILKEDYCNGERE